MSSSRCPCRHDERARKAQPAGRPFMIHYGCRSVGAERRNGSRQWFRFVMRPSSYRDTVRPHRVMHKRSGYHMRHSGVLFSTYPCDGVPRASVFSFLVVSLLFSPCISCIAHTIEAKPAGRITSVRARSPRAAVCCTKEFGSG